MNRTSVLDGVDAEFSNQSFMFQRLLISTKLIVHTLLHRSKLKCSSFSCQLANTRYFFVFVYDVSLKLIKIEGCDFSWKRPLNIDFTGKSQTKAGC